MNIVLIKIKMIKIIKIKIIKMIQHENLEILFETSFKNTIDSYFNNFKIWIKLSFTFYFFFIK